MSLITLVYPVGEDVKPVDPREELKPHNQSGPSNDVDVT